MIYTKDDYQRYVADDLRSVGRDSVPAFCRARLPSLYFVILLRKVELYKNTSSSSAWAQFRYRFMRARFARLSERLGFSIPLNVFGPGLSIAHIGTIVVNGDAKVGAFCRLHPGVTIGATRGDAPRLGNYVFLAPGAGIYGGIVVGDRVHVGPNAVVTTDIEAGSTVYPYRPHVAFSDREPWTSEVLLMAGQDEIVVSDSVQ